MQYFKKNSKESINGAFELMRIKNPNLNKLINIFELVETPTIQTNKQTNNNLKTKNMAKKAETTSSLYLQVVNGRLAEYLKDATASSVAVTDDNGKTKNYQFYSEMEGKLKQAYVYDKELDSGKEFEMLCIKIENEDGETETLTMPFKSSYAQSLIVRLDSIKLNEPIKIKAYKVKDLEKSKAKGKEVFNQGCTIEQNGVKIVNEYSKDGKKQLPEVKKNVTKKKGGDVTTYDFSDVEEFLRDIVKDLNEGLKPSNKSSNEVQGVDADDLDNDGLPF